MDTRKGSSNTWIEKTPSVELSSAAQLPEGTTCVCCCADGRFLGLGHCQGFSVWCASSLVCVAEWQQDTLETTHIHMTRMTEENYLLGTIDDMGVARVFLYRGEEIHLLTVINIMENVNKRSICLTFELSEGGNYGAASISCNGAVWLEVYHFPKEAWLKEAETAHSQKQDQNSSEDLGVKWSPVAVLMKINPPNIHAGMPLDIMQINDFLTQALAVNGHDSSSYRSDEQSANTDLGITKESHENQRRCTHHFLLPCVPFHGDSKTKSQPGVPVAVCVWWSGTNNLLHYLLQKAPKNKQDVEPMPDVLWPNSKEILCTAVSTCNRYIALGLDNALVCVWDRKSGSPLSVVLVSETDSSFCKMHFVDYCPASAGGSQTFPISLLVVCRSGAMHSVTTGRGTQSSTTRLKERPKDSGEIVTVIASVPFLPSLSIVMQRNGNIILQDVFHKTTVCVLIPPTSHRISSPCNPVYALNTELQTLFMQGEQEPSCSPSSQGGSQTQLYVFRFAECDIVKQYITSLPHCPPRQEAFSAVTLEESCNVYLQQRVLSAEERNKASEQTWEQLRETAEKIQQKQSR